MKKIAILAAVITPVMGHSLILAANPTANNGTGGIFMNVTSNGAALSVFRFDTIFAAVSGTAFQVQVYTRAGTYNGFESSNVGWTLSQTVAGTSNGSATFAPVNLTSNILVGAGQTVAVYMHSITTGNGIRYFGTGTTSNTNFSDANMTLNTAHSRTGAVAFAGSLFTPRALAGNVHYEVVPEPATMAALGLGALALIRRRRSA